MKRILKNNTTTILCIAGIAFWLVMAGLLVKRSYFPDVHSLSVSSISEGTSFLGEKWYGIYMRGSKIGYMTTTTRPSGVGYLITEWSLMRLNTLGTLQEIKMRTSTQVDQSFGLRFFTFHISSKMVDFRVKGELKGRKLFLTIGTGGEEKQSTLTLKETPYLWTNLRPFLASSGLEVGKKYRTLLFDPITLSNAEMIVEVVGIETLKIDGTERKAFRLKETFMGLEVTSWLDEEGETLKEESPMGLVMIREDQRKATAISLSDGIPTDILVSTSVPVTRKIETPRKVSYLKLKLGGLDLGGFDISDQRQRYRGNILEIDKETLPQTGAGLTPREEKKLHDYLAATPLIQSDHPDIMATARNITGGETDPLEAAKNISRWVFENLEKQYTFSIPSALEVLRIRTGDCNEHTALFTALSRASGIPTRIATGLIYYRGSFYYHAWAEVYLGGWIAIDPLLNQFPADATHIKLVEGGLDKQVQLVKVMGKLEIEVLDYK